MKILPWQKLVDLYNRGVVVEGELTWRLFTALQDESNIKEFFEQADAETVAMLLNRLKTEPVTDEEWGKVLMVGSNWSQKDSDETIPHIRRGVESLRKYLKEHGHERN